MLHNWMPYSIHSLPSPPPMASRNGPLILTILTLFLATFLPTGLTLPFQIILVSQIVIVVSANPHPHPDPTSVRPPPPHPPSHRHAPYPKQRPTQETSSPPSSDEEKQLRRARNTVAARKYRQKRIDRIAELEAALAAVTKERDDLKLELSRKDAEVGILKEVLAKRS
ncbi:hypothetical protein DL96DRAFT_1675134 [Flagelloscypha sp. PMI_526]|nr:hypothetical protein DL96DRAFT_1675134 [Flagelloscypha sp. PMI_526]